MFFEVWVDRNKKEEVKSKLGRYSEEIYEVSYDYDFIVRVDEKILRKIEGIRFYRKHYNC